MTRILLINPNTRNLGTLLTVLPPMGILYLASVLRETGHQVRVLDADIDDLGPDEIARAVADYEPEAVGITMNALQARQAYETVDLIKRVDSKILVVAGGPHPSALKGDILRRSPSIDAVVFGEGEATFPELVKAWEEGRSLAGVKGVCFREDGNVVVNGPREPIEDLDSLPRPALDLIAPIRRYPGAYPVGARPSIHLMASRGCPFRCTFCSNPVWERRLRLRSPESVVDEAEWLRREFKAREIFFQDDTFNLNRGWFEDICHGLIDRGLNRKVVFKSPFRANRNLLDLKLLKLAKRAGFWMIFYGVESGNQAVLEEIKKGLTLEEIERAFRLTRKAGLKTYASFMVGNLGESRRTVEETVEFAKRISSDYYGFAIATPYPGSEFHRQAIELGFLDPGFEEYRLDRYILRGESFAPGEVEELVTEADLAMKAHLSSLTQRLRGMLLFWRGREDQDRVVATETPDEEILDREIVMGENDWDVLGPGWYAVENWPPKIRWTGKRATAYLRSSEPSEHLFIKAVSPYVGVAMKISLNGMAACRWELGSGEWRKLELPLNDMLRDEPLRVDIDVDETWTPDAMLKNGDRRQLGVAVERIWLAAPDRIDLPKAI